MLIRLIVLALLLITVSARTYSQSLQLKNLRGQDPENRTLYLGLSNAFLVIGLRSDSKIISNSIGWRIKADTLILLPTKAGAHQLFIQSKGNNYTFSFDAKRLPDPFAVR